MGYKAGDTVVAIESDRDWSIGYRTNLYEDSHGVLRFKDVEGDEREFIPWADQFTLYNGDESPQPKPTETQVGGAHYKGLAIQPMEYALKNNLNYAQANVVKYITRYKDKGGVEDLRKAIHNVELLIEHEGWL